MPLQISFLPCIGLAALVAWGAAKYSESLEVSTALQVALPLATILYTLYYSWIYPLYVSPLRHIPTVPGFPLWGHFFAIITSECGVPARSWHQNYGPVVRYFFPFGSERLSIADDEAIKQMTIRNPYNYPKPERARRWMMPILGEGMSSLFRVHFFLCTDFHAGVLLAEGQEHVVQRKALTPAFSITSIRSLMPVFWEKSLHMARLWDSEMAAEGTTSKCFEVLEWLNRTTLDIIGRAGLGTDINSLDDPATPLRDAYRRCFDFDLQARVINGLAAFTSLVRLLPARANRDILIARDIILSRAQKIIQEKQTKAHIKDESRQRDIIGLIVKDNMTASAQDTLSLETMQNQVMTFLGAG